MNNENSLELVGKDNAVAADNEIAENFISPGAMLKKAREAKHLSQEHIAERLLLSKQFIVDLEQDNYAKIAASVYARGYLRSYAQCLEMDDEPLLQAFDRLNPAIGASHKHKPVDYRLNNDSLQYSKIRWVGYLFFSLLVLMVFGWIFSHHHVTGHEGLPAVGSISSFVPVASQIKPALDTDANTNSDDTLREVKQNSANAGQVDDVVAPVAGDASAELKTSEPKLDPKSRKK